MSGRPLAGPLAAACRRLWRDRRGAAAVVFALSIPLFIGASAIAIDTASHRFIHNRMQTAVDAAALAAVNALDVPAQARADALEFAQRNVPASYGTVTEASDVEIGIWDAVARTFTPATGTNVNAVRVTARRSADRGNAAPYVLGRFFGFDEVGISTVAIAARQKSVQYEPPERVELANEAHDFNEIYVYCFDFDGPGSAESRRSQMTLVSNNLAPGQSAITISGGFITENPPGEDLVWPTCAEGESLSFRLRNIRSAKHNPSLFRNPGRLQVFNHFTDTRIDEEGVEQFALTNNILETVRCDTLALCDPSQPGSQVPRGRGRTPRVERTPCLPGKFMYFGWEDRPPAGGSDRDYDDIVMVMRCPRTGILGDGLTRLVA